MALNKQSLAVPFSTQVDQKTDPLQIMPTSLKSLFNAVYTKDKRLTKRNGFGDLTVLPTGSNPLALTTFKENLEVIGSSILAYDDYTQAWVDRGRYQGCDLSVVSLTRSALSQTRVDAVTNTHGKTLAVWMDSDGTFKYQVSDAVTSQVLVGPNSLPATTSSAKANMAGNYFIVSFLVNVTATPTLRYIPIPFINLTPGPIVTISSQVESLTCGYNAITVNNILYYAWSGSDVGGAVRMTRLSPTLSTFSTAVVATGTTANLMSLSATMSQIRVNWYQDSDTSIHSLSTDVNLNVTNADTVVDDTYALAHLTAVVKDTTCTIFGEVINQYGYEAVDSNFIAFYSITGTTPTPPDIILRSVGLASEAFLYNDLAYFLTAYNGQFQPTYFLCDENGDVIAKLAYSNGGGYVDGIVLPSANLVGSMMSCGYLFKDLITSINKVFQPVSNDTGPVQFYTQTGANMASFDLAPEHVSSAEIGNNLHISGGYVWMYDGTQSVEHNFHLWPEDILATPSASGGTMTAQQYQYQVIYEWTDAQGNIHRSAPSIAVAATTSGSTGSVTLDIPTLRLTSKNEVKIVIYRWSAAQQNFYQITSISSPLLNDPTTDSVQYVDTLPDASILGNPLIYTTGGILENIAFPAASSLASFNNRLMVLASEDRNVVWYSKTVFQATPVEPTDLFTIYVAPNTGTQQSTGPLTILSAMDDKFLMFKEDAMYYLVGDGPNDTGGGQLFSNPTFIASTVGCSNQRSLALIPQGMMFQSDKGIWILGRDLSTQYIGAAVEDSTGNNVTSAVVVPDTNQARFCLDNGEALMYDYYYGRWAQFKNIPSVASTIYKGLHTYLSTELIGSIVRQETPGAYLDGSTPVCISFETAWMNLAGVQGLERMYQMFLLGTFITPHKLSLSIAYDYADDYSQNILITPDNYAGPWATSPNYWAQSGVWAGEGNIEQWQVFFDQQKVQSLKVRLVESYDPSQGGNPGEGLTLSGLNFIVGLKKNAPTLKASRSVG